MNKDKIVEGTITVTFNYREVVPVEWDDDKIEEYIEEHAGDYLDNDYEVESVSVDYVKVNNVGEDNTYSGGIYE